MVIMNSAFTRHGLKRIDDKDRLVFLLFFIGNSELVPV